MTFTNQRLTLKESKSSLGVLFVLDAACFSQILLKYYVIIFFSTFITSFDFNRYLIYIFIVLQVSKQILLSPFPVT